MSGDGFPLPEFVPAKLVDSFEIFVGPVYEKGPRGARSFAFLADARHVNRRGIVHGGMLATFADLALGAAIWDATDNAACVTLTMQMQFLKAARAGEVVEITPLILRRTRSLVFLRGDLTVAGEPVFSAASTWKLLGPAHASTGSA